eukprot:6094229-Prymnesium_polylepis.1
MFFVGQPALLPDNPHPHAQGVRSTADEAALAAALTAEVATHADVHIVNARDTYRTLSVKTIALFQWGLRKGAHFIMKTDDDILINAIPVVKQLAAWPTEEGIELYGGGHNNNEWQGNEYSQMKGADDSVAPYWNGGFYVLSASLARQIFDDDIAHTVLYMPYGSSSEDANMGKWMQHSERNHSMRVTHVKIKSCCQNIRSIKSKMISQSKNTSQSKGVRCGGHGALSCSHCPQGHGKQWCNGDCQWQAGQWGQAGTRETQNALAPVHRGAESAAATVGIKDVSANPSHTQCRTEDWSPV